MRTGLHKQDKTAELYFDEDNLLIEIRTHNTSLKNRLTSYSEKYPDLCKQTDEDAETGYKSNLVPKRLFGFKLTPLCIDERRRAASKLAKENGLSAARSNR